MLEVILEIKAYWISIDEDVENMRDIKVEVTEAKLQQVKSVYEYKVFGWRETHRNRITKNKRIKINFFEQAKALDCK